MSAALFALVIGGGLFLVSIVLPIVSFFRTRQLADDISRLRGRLDEIEHLLRRARTPVGKPAEADGAPAPPSASVPTPAPTPVPEPMVSPKAVTSPTVQESLESRIGGHWLLYVGTAALVLGIGFFVKYAFDNDWITETGRVLIGAIIGLVMVLGGHRIARRGYPLYGQILAGGGFAALYISVFAAFNYYSLTGRPVAFGLMVAITAGAALAADVHQSRGLALFAVAGGFLTPFLVGGDQNAQVALLTYDAILAAATMFVAGRHGWPFLNIVSFVFVLFTFASWADRYYTSAQWVPTQIFLTFFGGLYTVIAVRTRRLWSAAAAAVGALLFTTPVIFHVASVVNLQFHWMPFLVYLTLVALAGVAASMKMDAAWLRLAVFAATAPPLWRWLGTHHGHGWLLAPAVVVVALYAMMLVALGERLSRQPTRWLRGDLALFHASGLGLFGGLYAIFDPVASAWMAALALALALWHGAVAWAAHAASEEAGLNSLALAFAMLGFAFGLKLDQWWAVVGWAVESAAVIWVGLKARREWMRLGGALLLAWALVRLFVLGYLAAPAGFSPILNPRVGATLVIVAVFYALALVHGRFGGYAGDGARPEIATFVVLANVLTLVLLTTEINFYWRERYATDAAAGLARIASISVAWAVYGTALIVVGIGRRYAPIRYLAIALLALAAAKVFLFDLSALGGIYRIIGFVGLGVFLLLGAWLYQRYRDVIVGRD